MDEYLDGTLVCYCYNQEMDTSYDFDLLSDDFFDGEREDAE